MRAKLLRGTVVAALGAATVGCTYNVQGTPTYDSLGVHRLYELPTKYTYRNLGQHSWGFYRPGFAEPSISSVWEALSEKVIGLGGDVCIVRYESVGSITARTIEVTCEVLKVDNLH